MTAISWYLVVIGAVVLVYFVALNVSYLVTTLLSIAALRRHALRAHATDVSQVLTSGAPPVTLIAPAYNEAPTCVDAVTALLGLVYPEFEVLVVNDGSTDETLARLRDAFDLEPAPRAPTAELPTAAVRQTYRSRRRPNLWVVDKENGGKADALNAGIDYCETELFCALDADTLLERDALGRVVRPFLEDARTVAAGGIVRIVNDSQVRFGVVERVLLPRRMLARFQVLEYLRAFLAGRVGWDVMQAMLIISGAFGLFRRSVVVELGGYATDTVGEDMELVVRLHRHCLERGMNYRITFVPDPVAWTECPESLKVLGRQRDRWQRGLMQVLWRHRAMLLSRRYGRVGLVAFPFFFFLEGLGPVIELAGYVAFVLALAIGAWSPLLTVAFFAASFVFGAALSLAAIGLEELSFRRYDRWRDLFALMGIALLEPFGYRQLSTWWRVKGFVSALRGVSHWGHMERRGFRAATAAALCLALALPVSAAAQDSTVWTARASYGRETFATSQAAWQPWESVDASFGRRFTRGSVALLAQRATRFRLTDVAYGVDAYSRLSRGAYANLRVDLAPGADVLARSSVAAELFQGAGRGWEPSIAFRRMSFASTDVNIAAASLAKYAGAWYVRARSTWAWRARDAANGGTGGAAGVSALARRYLGERGDMVEASAGASGEAVTLAPSSSQPVTDIRRTTFASAGAQLSATRSLSLSLGLGYTTFQGAPHRIGSSAGVILRW